MISLRSLAIVTLGAVSASACGDSPTEGASTNLFVVEAFLFAGEPIRDVRVTETRSLSSSDTTPVPIDDASVRLIRDGTSYDLVASGQDGYYQDPGNVLVSVGDRFTIEVSHQGLVATGETTVPPPPEDVALSSSVLLAPQFRPGQGIPAQDSSSEIAATWSNPNGLLHFIVVESLDANAESILPERARGRIGGFRLVSLPTDDDAAAISARTLEYLGNHRVTVYRINEEYAQLYQNRTQDSRDLNEPPTNIRAGLGVFSAFSSDSAFFAVVRQ